MMSPQFMIDEDVLYRSNLRLNRIERALGRIHLRSMPSYISLVIGDRCNIDCPYCYQAKTGDGLFQPAEIGPLVRRELQAFYPYLSTLRVQGGEVFVNPGFEELVDDVSTTLTRPVLSISTNGTLINDRWAGRLVDERFKEVTFSIDGATEETFAKLRRGARLKSVMGNLERLQTRKAKCGSVLPQINIFCVIMRSNFREFGGFLELARNAGVDSISFQTMGLGEHNLARHPDLVQEDIRAPEEVAQLHQLVREALARERAHFREINISGLKSVFAQHHLDTDFITEDFCPDKPPIEDAGGRETTGEPNPDPSLDPALAEIEYRWPIEQDSARCANPWTLMYLTERGTVHICYMATPVGNVYETPLVELWNSPKAVAARARIVRGRYLEAGCSEQWCSHKEGLVAPEVNAPELIAEFSQLVRGALGRPDSPPDPDPGSLPDVIRRLLAGRTQRIAELEWNLTDLCQKNQSMLDEIDKQRQTAAARAKDLEKQVVYLGGKPNRDQSFSDTAAAGSAAPSLGLRALAAALRSLRKVERRIERAIAQRQFATKAPKGVTPKNLAP